MAGTQVNELTFANRFDSIPPGNHYFSGQLDELRFSDSYRYPGNGFTPPMQPFSVDANTMFLYRFDEESPYTFFNDSSPNQINGLVWNSHSQFVPSTVPYTPPSPTPTPSPVPNNSPVITTQSLPNGKVGVDYRTEVIGYDLNKNDSLTMTVMFLPDDGQIVMNPCVKKIDADKVTIRCPLRGTPTEAATYNPVFTLQDGKGGTVTKKLPILITR